MLELVLWSDLPTPAIAENEPFTGDGRLPPGDAPTLVALEIEDWRFNAGGMTSNDSRLPPLLLLLFARRGEDAGDLFEELLVDEN